MHITTGCSILPTLSAASAPHALQAAKQSWSLHCHNCLHVRKAQHWAAPAADSRAQTGHDSCSTKLELTEQQAACKKMKALLLASWHWHPIPSRWQAPAAAGSTVLLRELCRHAISPLQIPLGPTAPGSLGDAADVSWSPATGLWAAPASHIPALCKAETACGCLSNTFARLWTDTCASQRDGQTPANAVSVHCSPSNPHSKQSISLAPTLAQQHAVRCTNKVWCWCTSRTAVHSSTCELPEGPVTSAQFQLQTWPPVSVHRTKAAQALPEAEVDMC